MLLVFGSGKLGDVGGSVGRSIREFRKASSEDDITPLTASIVPTPTVALPTPDAQSANGVGRFCVECGNIITEGQKFCASCGTRIATPASD